jgi:hypothetical protein
LPNERLHRRCNPLQLFQRIAAVVEGRRKVGLERQRAVVARQRLVEPLQLLQRNAAVVEGLRIVGLERERLVVARQRLVKPLQLFQRNATVVEGLSMRDPLQAGSLARWEGWLDRYERRAAVRRDRAVQCFQMAC